MGNVSFGVKSLQFLYLWDKPLKNELKQFAIPNKYFAKKWGFRSDTN